jgi:serine/threonine protein kinase
MINNEKDLTGKQLSNYKVIGMLGKGGMATVYKAHELSLNRVVALKVLSDQLSEDKDYIKRFEREAQAAAQLNHPNIVQVYAIGEEKGVHYFAMEYIKGKSLAEIMKEEGVMAPEKAVAIIKQAADALGEAHGVGLVHRDIKPSNIMIDAAGRPKVTDFGIAYISTAQTKLTREGSIIGTPEYLSPEQCEGKIVDGRSDIYSLGVTLYELLTGKTPYEADTPVSMLMKIVKGDFPPISEIKPDVPPAIRKIVEKMMQTDPNKRYGSMAEVIKDFNEYEKSLSASAGPAARMPATITYQEIEAQQSTASPSAKSSKWAAVIVAAVIVLLMGGAFAAKVLYFDKKAKSTPAGQETAAVEQTSPSGAVSETGQTTETPGQGETADTQGTSGQEMSAESQPGSGEGQQTVGGGNTETAGTAETPITPSSTTFPSSSVTTTAGTADTSGTSGTSGAAVTGTGTHSSSPIGTRQSITTKPVSPRTVKPLPPANSCIITAVGDEDRADLVTPYIQEILARKNFTIIDGPSVADRDLSEVARSRIVITVKQIGTTTLNYYGSSSEQYTVQLTIKVVDLKTGKTVSGPVIETVEYTTLNAQEKLKKAAAKLIARIRL